MKPFKHKESLGGIWFSTKFWPEGEFGYELDSDTLKGFAQAAITHYRGYEKCLRQQKGFSTSYAVHVIGDTTCGCTVYDIFENMGGGCIYVATVFIKNRPHKVTGETFITADAIVCDKDRMKGIPIFPTYDGA